MSKHVTLLRYIVKTVEYQFNSDVGELCRDERDNIWAAADAFDAMLKALKEALASLTMTHQIGGDPEPLTLERWMPRYESLIAQLNAAIAKAEGRT